MDAIFFSKMLSDKNLFNLKKMQYKYSASAVSEMLNLLKQGFYQELPIKDFSGNSVVYLKSIAQINTSAFKALFAKQPVAEAFGIKAMEEELHSTLIIENIQSSREDIHKILRGVAPVDEAELRIYGLKKGLDFISDPCNKINEENIHRLYRIAIHDSLDKESLLKPGEFYRHDRVFIVGAKVEHQGLDHQRLPDHMALLVDFINKESTMNDLLKAAAVHFYIAYLHPYFDGNGRMARLIHQWYLVQRGFPSALFIPLSSYINQSKKGYYYAFTQIEENLKISQTLDITPFLIYFSEKVYNQIGETKDKSDNQSHVIEHYQKALAAGEITEKEKDLFGFVLSVYGNQEFSTKQLERDFNNAAYATIRKFVLKFKELKILTSQDYGNRVKYRLN